MKQTAIQIILTASDTNRTRLKNAVTVQEVGTSAVNL